MRFALLVMQHKFGTCFWLGSAPTLLWVTAGAQTEETIIIFFRIEFRPWFRILCPSLVFRLGPGVFCFWIASVAVIFDHEAMKYPRFRVSLRCRTNIAPMIPNLSCYSQNYLDPSGFRVYPELYNLNPTPYKSL